MVDPTTTNRAFNVPTRGSNTGVWDTPLNSNFTLLDTLLGGVSTVSVTNVDVTLNSTQYGNLTVRLTGTLLANLAVIFPDHAAFYVVENLTAGNFVAQLYAGAGTERIAIPQGSRCMVITDGAGNMRFANDAMNGAGPGTMIPFAGLTIPAWMTACTKQPYLYCNGAEVSRTTYADLYRALGGASSGWGQGNGTTTFNVPDLRGRALFGQDTMGVSAAGRLTTGGSGVDGATVGATGGAQNITLDVTMIPSHGHTAVVTDAGHAHTWGAYGNQPERVSGVGTTGVTVINSGATQSTGSSVTGITVANSATGGGGAHFNVPPAAVAPWLIKT